MTGIPGDGSGTEWWRLEEKDDLRLRLNDLVPPGQPHVRHMVFNEIYDRLPRDPEVRVGLYTSELLAGKRVGWHVHNGSVFFLVVQGEIELQYAHGTEYYRAGQAYTEPIGQIHRAVNPNPERSAIFFGVAITAADRDHVVNTGSPDWHEGD